MAKHPMSHLFDPQTIGLWFDDSTAPSLRAALTQGLSVYKGHFSIWPECTAASIDLALIATEGGRLSQSLVEAAGKGAKAAVIYTVDVPSDLQRSLREQALRLRIALVGPSSFGFQRPSQQLNASLCSTTAQPGRLALVSQSGALASSIIDWAAEYKLGFSAVMTLGDQIDVDNSQILDFLSADHQTQAIVLYLQGVTRPRAFLSALRAAASVKPVILLKAGAAEEDAFNAAIRRSGAIRVRHFMQLFEAARVLTSNKLPLGGNLAIVSNGRGPAVLVQDLAAESDSPIEAIPDSHVAIVREDSDGKHYEQKILAFSKDPNIHGILAIHSPQIGVHTEQVSQAVARTARNVNAIVLGCWLGGQTTRESRTWLSAQGVPTFRTPEAAVDAFSSLTAFRSHQELLQQVPSAVGSFVSPDLEGARMILETALVDRRRSLTEIESKSLLSAFGVPVLTTLFARSAGEAALIAHQIGFPVSIKRQAQAGGKDLATGDQRMNLKNAQDVRAAYSEIAEHLAVSESSARMEGVVLQRHVERLTDEEAAISVTSDPLFGPIISFGSSATSRDRVGDCAMELPPLNDLLAKRLIERARKGEQFDQRHVEAYVTALLQVSDLVCELPAIKTLTIDPLVLIGPEAVAAQASVDIEMSHDAAGPRYGHLAIMPYPAHFTEDHPLKDGRTYTIRPLRWTDAEQLKRLLASLSEESRFMRFLSNIKEYTPKQLARLTQIDYCRDMAMVACIRHEDHEEIIGVSRYMLLPSSQAAEFALVVKDSYQGQGIGATLMTSLFNVAKEQQLKELEGVVLAKNTQMLKLMGRLGFRIEAEPEDATLRKVVKTILH